MPKQTVTKGPGRGPVGRRQEPAKPGTYAANVDTFVPPVKPTPFIEPEGVVPLHQQAMQPLHLGGGANMDLVESMKGLSRNLGRIAAARKNQIDKAEHAEGQFLAAKNSSLPDNASGAMKEGYAGIRGRSIGAEVVGDIQSYIDQNANNIADGAQLDSIIDDYVNDAATDITHPTAKREFASYVSSQVSAIQNKFETFDAERHMEATATEYYAGLTGDLGAAYEAGESPLAVVKSYHEQMKAALPGADKTKIDALTLTAVKHAAIDRLDGDILDQVYGNPEKGIKTARKDDGTPYLTPANSDAVDNARRHIDRAVNSEVRARDLGAELAVGFEAQKLIRDSDLTRGWLAQQVDDETLTPASALSLWAQHQQTVAAKEEMNQQMDLMRQGEGELLRDKPKKHRKSLVDALLKEVNGTDISPEDAQQIVLMNAQRLGVMPSAWEHRLTSAIPADGENWQKASQLHRSLYSDSQSKALLLSTLTEEQHAAFMLYDRRLMQGTPERAAIETTKLMDGDLRRDASTFLRTDEFNNLRPQLLSAIRDMDIPNESEVYTLVRNHVVDGLALGLPKDVAIETALDSLNGLSHQVVRIPGGQNVVVPNGGQPLPEEYSAYLGMMSEDLQKDLKGTEYEDETGYYLRPNPLDRLGPWRVYRAETHTIVPGQETSPYDMMAIYDQRAKLEQLDAKKEAAAQEAEARRTLRENPQTTAAGPGGGGGPSEGGLVIGAIRAGRRRNRRNKQR